MLEAPHQVRARLNILNPSVNPDPWSRTADGVVNDRRFKLAMGKVYRWNSKLENDPHSIKLPTGIFETNAHHIKSVQCIYDNEIKMHCKNTIKQMDERQLNLFFSIHDMGEIMTGDLPSSIDSAELHRRKNRMEPLAVIFLTKNLQEPAKSEIRTIFKRYKKREHNDKEAHMTKWLDLMQGNRFALDNSLFETIENTKSRYKNIKDSIYKFLNASQALINAFDTNEAKLEISSFTKNEIERFLKKDYGSEVNQAFYEFNTKKANSDTLLFSPLPVRRSLSPLIPA